MTHSSGTMQSTVLSEACELVQNRNESRVFLRMQHFFEENDKTFLTSELYCQIFACALNLLPPRYMIRGTIILRDPVTEQQIDNAIRVAYFRVTSNPK